VQTPHANLKKAIQRLGLYSFEEVVGRDFKHGICNEKDHERNRVFIIRHVGFLEKGFPFAGVEGFGITF